MGEGESERSSERHQNMIEIGSKEACPLYGDLDSAQCWVNKVKSGPPGLNASANSSEFEKVWVGPHASRSWSSEQVKTIVSGWTASLQGRQSSLHALSVMHLQSGPVSLAIVNKLQAEGHATSWD